MSKPPPPRYQIVERDGRLVTIDTWAKGTPTAPTAPLPAENRARMAAPRPASGGTPRGIAALGDLLVAALVQTRDAAGRRVLTTGPRWDKRGPRAIALDANGERRLGRVLAIAVAVLLTAIVAVVIDSDLFLVVLVLAALLASSLGTVAHGLVTRFLDTLDPDLPH